jgi:hypothetical protein
MLVKLVTFANDLTLLNQKLAELFAPFENAYDMPNRTDKTSVSPTGHILAYYETNGNLKGTQYHNVSKSQTYTKGNQSVAMLQIEEDYIPMIVEPLVISGALEVLGSEVNYGEDPSETFSEDDWNTVRQINPKWGTTETTNIFGKEVTIPYGFFDMA